MPLTEDHTGPDRLAESEWRQATRHPAPLSPTPAATEADGAADLRRREWEKARPTDHQRRRALAGRQI